MNAKIALHVISLVNNSKRQLESRALARNLSRQYHTSIYRIYGIFGYLTKTNKISWAVRVKGGKSYII